MSTQPTPEPTATSKTVIENVTVNPHTGHIILTLRVHNEDGNKKWYGPARQYGFDAAVFQNRFGGDVEQLKSHVVGQHQAYTGVHDELVSKLVSMKGQAIG